MEEEEKKTVHLSENKMLTGTIAGLAEYFGIDTTLARIGYVLVTLITAGLLGIIAYVIIYLIIKNNK